MSGFGIEDPQGHGGEVVQSAQGKSAPIAGTPSGPRESGWTWVTRAVGKTP